MCIILCRLGISRFFALHQSSSNTQGAAGLQVWLLHRRCHLKLDILSWMTRAGSSLGDLRGVFCILYIYVYQSCIQHGVHICINTNVYII